MRSPKRSKISGKPISSLGTNKKSRVVVDSIHGTIRPEPHEWKIIDTATFQRLRHIKQLGLGHVTYPNATHTRFAHSLGVLAIMARVTEAAREPLSLNDREIEELRLAALLHDIGHYPYSHLMEGIDNVVLTEEQIVTSGRSHKKHSLSLTAKRLYPDHEELGRLIVTNQKDIRTLLGSVERATRIADLFTRSEAADAQTSKLIHSSLDMDRLDYLIRDARFAGVPYGEIDHDYLLENVKASPSGMIGIKYKALSAAEQFLLARFFMHKTVYYHKTTFGLEEAFRQLLRRCRDIDRHGVPKDGDRIREIVSDSATLLTFTDSFLDRIVQSAMSNRDPVIKALAHAIILRRPPRLLREEYALVDESDPQSRTFNCCTSFVDKCKANLESLAKKHNVELGLFLLASPKSTRLEKRGSLLSHEDAKNQPAEPKDELIKVFVKNEPEPRSLVDISESILHACAHHSLRIARLYVVEQDEKKLSHLRRDVEAW